MKSAAPKKKTISKKPKTKKMAEKKPPIREGMKLNPEKKTVTKVVKPVVVVKKGRGKK